MRRAISILCLFALVPLALLFLRVSAELPAENRALVREKYASWSGVLRIWVYDDWDARALGWLNRAISSYEKRHPGVYVQARSVDAEAVRAFATSGINPPDMLLVPPGVLESADHLAELGGLPKMKGALADCGDGFAAPVLMGAYGWAYNRRMLDGIPASWEGVDVAAPSDMAIALVALCSGEMPVEIQLPGLDLGLPTSADVQRCRLPDGFELSDGAYAAFVAGRAAAIPVTQRDVRKLAALSDAGRGPDWAVSASGSAMLADQLLLLGIVDWPRDDIADRHALCREFLDHLLSDEIQKTLSTAGAFPVIETSALYAGRGGYDGLEIASNLPLLVPSAFSTAWREPALAAAGDFIGGRASAVEGLRRIERALEGQ